MGKHLPSSTPKPWAVAEVLSWATRRDLPMPASPQSRSNWPCPLLVWLSRCPEGRQLGISTNEHRTDDRCIHC